MRVVEAARGFLPLISPSKYGANDVSSAIVTGKQTDVEW
jgi:hypothetical protein